MKAIAHASAGLLIFAVLAAMPAFAQTADTAWPASPAAYEAGLRHAGMQGMSDEDETEGTEVGPAHVMLSRGDAKIDLTCAAGDSTMDCVNAAVVLLDHVEHRAAEKKQPSPPPGAPSAPQSQPSAASPPPPPPPGPAAH